MSKKSDDFIQHYGVPGMKWGRRKARSESSSGSSKRPASEDAQKADHVRQQIKKSGLASVNNSDLRKLNERMQLEANYSNLVGQKKSTIDRGHGYVKKVLAVGATANSAYQFYKSPAGQMIKKSIFS